MPAGDRTGPTGMGPRTGRAAGYCSGSGVPGYANPGPGRGYGAGFGWDRGSWGRGFRGGGSRGGGHGWRNQFYATGLPGWVRYGGYAAPYQRPDPELEKQALRDEAEALQSELDSIRKRLSEIESAASESGTSTG